MLKHMIFEKLNLLKRNIIFLLTCEFNWKNNFNLLLKSLIFSICKDSFFNYFTNKDCAFALCFFYQIAGYAGPRGISPKGEKGKSGPRGLNIFLNNIIMCTIIYNPYIIIIFL